jgi:folate-binding protein YgfZ
MTTLTEWHQQLGARLAADNIPLDYGAVRAEWEAALGAVVLLDRSHEGRISLNGRDSQVIVDRMTTNRVKGLTVGSGCATVFTSPTARIIERAEVYQRGADLLLITHPPRRDMMTDLLKRSIFYGDQVTVRDETASTAMLALHGPAVDAALAQVGISVAELGIYSHISTVIDNMPVHILRRPSLVGLHIALVTAAADAAAVHRALLSAGKPVGLMAGGSLLYNALRIRAGIPSLPELGEDYLPLEVGLWSDISFSKGCYTGQEIIARMDSREKLARVLVRLHLQKYVPAPQPVMLNGQQVGTMTSSVTAPDDTVYAMGVVKTLVKVGTPVTINGAEAAIGELLGHQPHWVTTG